jgi:hypothetical protein
VWGGLMSYNVFADVLQVVDIRGNNVITGIIATFIETKFLELLLILKEFPINYTIMEF